MRHLRPLLVVMVVITASCAFFDQKPVCPTTNPNCNTLPEVPTQNGYEGAPRGDAGASG